MEILKEEYLILLVVILVIIDSILNKPINK